MVYDIQLEQEVDGRWLADLPEVPGALVYGSSRKDATKRVQALVLRILAERLKHDESIDSRTNQEYVFPALRGEADASSLSSFRRLCAADRANSVRVEGHGWPERRTNQDAGLRRPETRRAARW